MADFVRKVLDQCLFMDDHAIAPQQKKTCRIAATGHYMKNAEY